MTTEAVCMVLWCLISAWQEADNDRDKILAGRYVNHAMNLIRRVVIVGVGYVTAAIFTRDYWALALFAPLAWSVFTMAFRLMLNLMRDLPWWYVNASNTYDSFWISINFLTTMEDDPERAGKMAYIFEAVVLVGSIVALIIYNT